MPISKTANTEVANALRQVKGIYQNPNIPEAEQNRRLKKLHPIFTKEVGKQLGVPSQQAYSEAVRRGYIR